MKPEAMQAVCKEIGEQLNQIHAKVLAEKEILASYSRKREMKTMTKQDMEKEVGTAYIVRNDIENRKTC